MTPYDLWKTAGPEDAGADEPDPHSLPVEACPDFWELIPSTPDALAEAGVISWEEAEVVE